MPSFTGLEPAQMRDLAHTIRVSRAAVADRVQVLGGFPGEDVFQGVTATEIRQS
jgi:hypothetical protein